MVIPGGFTYFVRGGIPSGSVWTTLVGTLCNMLMLRILINRLSRSYSGFVISESHDQVNPLTNGPLDPNTVTDQGIRARVHEKGYVRVPFTDYLFSTPRSKGEIGDKGKIVHGSIMDRIRSGKPTKVQPTVRSKDVLIQVSENYPVGTVLNITRSSCLDRSEWNKWYGFIGGDDFLLTHPLQAPTHVYAVLDGQPQFISVDVEGLKDVISVTSNKLFSMSLKDIIVNDPSYHSFYKACMDEKGQFYVRGEEILKRTVAPERPLDPMKWIDQLEGKTSTPSERVGERKIAALMLADIASDDRLGKEIPVSIKTLPADVGLQFNRFLNLLTSSCNKTVLSYRSVEYASQRHTRELV